MRFTILLVCLTILISCGGDPEPDKEIQNQYTDDGFVKAVDGKLWITPCATETELKETSEQLYLALLDSAIHCRNFYSIKVDGGYIIASDLMYASDDSLVYYDCSGLSDLDRSQLSIDELVIADTIFHQSRPYVDKYKFDTIYWHEKEWLDYTISFPNAYKTLIGSCDTTTIISDPGDTEGGYAYRKDHAVVFWLEIGLEPMLDTLFDPLPATHKEFLNRRIVTNESSDVVGVLYSSSTRPNQKGGIFLIKQESYYVELIFINRFRDEYYQEILSILKSTER